MLSVLNLERAEGIFLDTIREKIRKRPSDQNRESDNNKKNMKEKDE